MELKVQCGFSGTDELTAIVDRLIPRLDYETKAIKMLDYVRIKSAAEGLFCARAL